MKGIEIIKNFFPSSILAFTTNRKGGHSKGKYNSLNLGFNVGDEEKSIKKNKSIVLQMLNNDVCWMNQTHSSIVNFVKTTDQLVNADGIISTNTQSACGVLTADCLPVLVCTSDAKLIGCVHVGWKGLSREILENFYQKIILQESKYPIKKNVELIPLLYIWFGPCICKKCFEVGNDVRSSFTDLDKRTEKFFNPTYKRKWYCDLRSLAVYKTKKFFKVNKFLYKINVDNRCTFKNKEYFFSYRRDGITGRMASVISNQKCTKINY